MTATFDYDVAAAILGTRQCKKVDHNTFLHWLSPKQIAVKLHKTDIAVHFEDGTVVLNTDDWRTVTTKDRMNKFTPARVWTENNVWRVGDAFFQEGIKVDREGQVQGNYIPWEKAMSQKHYLDKAVLKYIKDYAEHCRTFGLPNIDQNVCLSCVFADGDLKNLKISEPVGVYHLIDHIRAEEYPAQLLYKAVKVETKNKIDLELYYDQIRYDLRNRGEFPQSQVRVIVRALTNYFRKRKPAMLDMLLLLDKREEPEKEN